MNSEHAGWKRVCQQLIAMERGEIVDRIRQHAAAHVDLLRYKAGAEFAPQIQPVPAGSRPKFFFSPDAVPELCAQLRHLFPETAERIVERAERICGHRVDLLGFKDIHYGSEIDWHCDRVHGKRAPRVPWFRVNYLDFAEVGDSKVTWELNRHQHLVTLAKAFRLSGNEKFAAELFRQWHHWHGENPYPIGINWASSLEVAFRSLSWLWMYFLLVDSPIMPGGFREEWLRAVAVAGRHIDCNLSTYFSPNTHLLGEAVALFFIGTLCPEIPAAPRWRERGWKIIQQEAERQVQSDGLHFEQSTYYHVYALDFFLHSAVLASANQIQAPTQFDRTIERMLEALAALARSGRVPGLGDDDGGRLFDASRNRAEHLMDPLATGAVLFGRGDFKALAGGLREETLWLLGAGGIQEFENLPSAPPLNNSVAMRAAGLYLMSGDNAKCRLVIDAGPQGAHSAGHGHADALSLTASSGGWDLLIDSGTLEYVGAHGARDRFRGTRAHNTMLVAGQDQAEPKGPFSWGRLPHVEAEGWIAGKTFDLFVGSHDGYSRLPNPVVHRRFVFALKSGFWLVRDLALGFGEYSLDLFWHLAPGLAALDSTDNDVFLRDGEGLRFVTAEGHGWTQKIEEHPHSPVYGSQENHFALHFSAQAQLPVEFVTVILQGVEASRSKPQFVRRATPTASSVVGYRYQSSRETRDVFFGQGAAWKLDEWSSDAEFLCWSDAGESVVLICCNASFVEWAGGKLVFVKQRVLRCEVIERSGQFEVISSDPDLVAVDREVWVSMRNNLKNNSRGEFAGKLNMQEKDQKEKH